MTVVLYADVAPLANDTIFNAYFEKLPGFRKEKINRLKLRTDKNLSLGAWIVLKEALKSFDCELSTAGFEYTKGGKPVLKNRPDIHFSISHSESVAMCAVSDKPVGVDVEHISQFKESVCRRFFKKSECNYVLDVDDICEQTKHFFRLWVLKESFVKYTGRGIGEFGDFEIDITKAEPGVVHCKMAGSCFFCEPDLPGYRVAVCLDEKDEIRFERMNFNAS